MLKDAKTVAVLSDSKKTGINESFIVCSLEKVDVLVTDLPSDDPQLDTLRFKNLKII